MKKVLLILLFVFALGIGACSQGTTTAPGQAPGGTEQPMTPGTTEQMQQGQQGGTMTPGATEQR